MAPGRKTRGKLRDDVSRGISAVRAWERTERRKDSDISRADMSKHLVPL